MSRRSRYQCLNEQEIEEFIFNRLSGVTREAIEEHILACPACVAKLEREEAFFHQVRKEARIVEHEALARAFSGVPAKVPSHSWGARVLSFFTPRARITFTLAAACALLICTTVVLKRQSAARSPQLVALELHRGAFVSAEAQAGAPLSFSLAVEDLPAGMYRMELVDSSGKLLFSATSQAQGGKLRWDLNRSVPAGIYWVRVRKPGDESILIREYGLKLVP